MREPKCLGVSVRTLGGSDGEKAGGLPHGRPWLCAVAALLCPVALLAPATAGARDLVVYGEPTLEKALKSVGSLWQARTGTRVNVFVAPTDLSYRSRRALRRDFCARRRRDGRGRTRQDYPRGHHQPRVA